MTNNPQITSLESDNNDINKFFTRYQSALKKSDFLGINTYADSKNINLPNTEENVSGMKILTKDERMVAAGYAFGGGDPNDKTGRTVTAVVEGQIRQPDKGNPVGAIYFRIEQRAYDSKARVYFHFVPRDDQSKEEVLAWLAEKDLNPQKTEGQLNADYQQPFMKALTEKKFDATAPYLGGVWVEQGKSGEDMTAKLEEVFGENIRPAVQQIFALANEGVRGKNPILLKQAVDAIMPPARGAALT